VSPRIAKALVAASEELARRDPVLAEMLERVGPCDFRRGRPRAGHFAELARAILYQQLAGGAASAIHARFAALFDGGVPTAEAVAALPVARLRGAGLSGAKAASIRDLADKVRDGTVRLDRIARRSDEEVVRELTLVRGIGRWTAEMFLIFTLRRLDVWPVDDYGVRKGYARLYRRSALPTPRELEGLGDGFRPYRSVAAWYCWRAVDTVTPGSA
jgi:DNA-3-methyladenine glycosylase II